MLLSLRLGKCTVKPLAVRLGWIVRPDIRPGSSIRQSPSASSQTVVLSLADDQTAPDHGVPANQLIRSRRGANVATFLA